MTTYDSDTRVQEADLLLSEFEQRGADSDAVTALLPALVSGNESTRAAAQRWIEEHALIGLDLSDEGRAEAARVTRSAQQYAQSLGESGASIPGFTERFNSGSEQSLNKALDDRTPLPDYPGAKHNQAVLSGEPEVESNPLTLRDTSPRQHTSEFSRRYNRRSRTLDLSTPATDDPADADAYGSGVSKPFFMED